MKIFLLTSLWLAMHSSIFCQKQNNIWCFGQNAGIDFNSDPPSPLTSKMVAINESASIADPFGQLLFYSNGIKVWDRNNNIMPNGMNLMGGKFSYQPVIIVPFPGSKYQYYIFSVLTQRNLRLVKINFFYFFSPISSKYIISFRFCKDLSIKACINSLLCILIPLRILYVRCFVHYEFF